MTIACTGLLLGLLSLAPVLPPAVLPSAEPAVPGLAAEDDEQPINTICPVMPDEAADPRFTLRFKGRLIGFCCRFCPDTFREDPRGYMANLPAATPAVAAGGGTAAGDSPAAASGLPADDAGTAAAAADDDDVQALPVWFGRSHVVFVHFPIGLLVAAALAEFFTRRREGVVVNDAAYFCLRLGATFALLVAWTGWSRAEAYPTPLVDELFLHRWIGASTFFLSVTAWVLAARARSTGATPAARTAYRVALALMALATMGAGHFGGVLVHKPGYLFG